MLMPPILVRINMRRFYGSAIAVAALTFLPGMVAAQGMDMKDGNTKVAGGGVFVPGWTGKPDGAGKLEDAKFVKEGDAFHVTTGPAVTYWNPANKASGDYTVKATFKEPAYMALNDHPHPYGIIIGGNDMGSDTQSLVYCEAYGNGTFIVRGFGPAPFKVNTRPEANAAIHKAAAKGDPVVQEIAMSVKGDKVSCSVNGTVVGTYDKAMVVGPGKLKTTDGVYGVRMAHNTEAIITGFSMTKN
jgi:hypothetical protein